MLSSTRYSFRLSLSSKIFPCKIFPRIVIELDKLIIEKVPLIIFLFRVASKVVSQLD